MNDVFKRFAGCIAAFALFWALPVNAFGGTVYFTEPNSNVVRSVDSGGGAATTVIASGSFPIDVAVDGASGKLYWIETGFGSHRIRSGNLDGTGATTLTTITDTTPQSLALDLVNNKVYWSNNNGGSGNDIRRANLDGTAVAEIVSSFAPLGIAVDGAGGKLYWADPNGATNQGSIYQSNLDGSGKSVLLSGLHSPYEGLALDLSSGHIYWTNYSGMSIERANLDGTGRTTVLSGLSSNPYDIAIDPVASRMYWSQGNSLLAANLDGSGQSVLYTGTNWLGGIAVASNAAPVPEPTSLLLAALGGLGLLGNASRRRQNAQITATRHGLSV